MEIGITKISKKGQIVIPAEIRRDLNIRASDKFMVFGKKDTILMKKIGKPEIEEGFEEMADAMHKAVAKSDFTRKDLETLIGETRKNKR